jgi:hypothetical protein
MADRRQIVGVDLAEPVGQRRGIDVYDRNPSVRPGGIPIRQKQVKVADGEKMLMIGSATGEVLGEGQALYVENKLVDRERFVKVYPSLVKKLKDLSNPAREVFEVAFLQMLSKHQQDKIELNYYTARKYGLSISDRGYQRGVRELLEKEILYQSPSADLYFVNVDYWFNGNRVTLAESYYYEQQEARSDDLKALPAPAEEGSEV